jgi:hypothetical protein
MSDKPVSTSPPASTPKPEAASAAPRVTVVVCDIADAGVVAQTEEEVRRVFREASATLKWTVAIAASTTRGRWDVTLTGPTERHVMSFTSSTDRVPDLTAQYVKRAITRLTLR